jgi:hypothetical protein
LPKEKEMPWTTKDVERFKKGLTPAQKKKWVSVANGVLKDCQAKGGSGCEGKAIRIANSKFSEVIMKKEKIPNGALRRGGVGEDWHAFAGKGKEGELKKLQMTIYSGGVIKGHFWWGDLAVDLDGLKFSKKKFPVLEQHDQNRKIAFTGKPIVDGALKLDPDKTTFVSTPESEEFQKLSAEGFPYQASMYALPTSVERLSEDETAKVNGFTLKGPASIWRKAEFQEASICVFGWDKQTESKAFSKTETTELQFEEVMKETEDETDDNKLSKEVNEVEIKTVEELTKAYPELVQKLTDDLTSNFDAEKATLEKDHKKEVDQLSKDKEDLGDRVVDLEKRDLARNEREMKSDADTLFNNKLAASDIPERLYDKIRKLVNHNKYVKDDKLDKAAFTEAIDNEIKFFEESGVTTEVMGMGSSARSEEDPEKLAEKKEDDEDDEAVNKYLELADDAPKKE